MTRFQIFIGTIFIAAVCGCTNLYVEDCPEGGVVGKDVNRLRTVSYRSTLDNSPAAARRFLSLAAMSGLAYWHDGGDCKFEDNHLSKEDAAALQKVLDDASPAPSWQSVKFDKNAALPTECQDEIGLYFHVWQRANKSGPDDAVIAFRGTSNNPDWVYGNLWWVTRFFVKDNQFSRSKRLLEVALTQLNDEAQRAGKPTPRVVATGHSLGGGLAQYALYNYPSNIKQAIVFDPSPVTAYVASSHGKEVLESGYDSDLKTEARIIRIYESKEILSNLRIWHKIFFPSHLQIQEVRFAFYDGRNSVKAHSMRDLTFSMHKESRLPIAEAMAQEPWYASLAQGCTLKIEKAQKKCNANAKGCTSP